MGLPHTRHFGLELSFVIFTNKFTNYLFWRGKDDGWYDLMGYDSRYYYDFGEYHSKSFITGLHLQELWCNNQGLISRNQVEKELWFSTCHLKIRPIRPQNQTLGSNSERSDSRKSDFENDLDTVDASQKRKDIE